MAAGAHVALADLTKELGAVLDKAQSLLLSTDPTQQDMEDPYVLVNSDSILVFDPNDGQLDYPLEDLRNSLSSAAERADRSIAALNVLEPKQTRTQRRYRAEAITQSYVIRDSLREIVRLLNGEKLEEPEPREFENDLTTLDFRTNKVYATGGFIPSEDESKTETILSGTSTPSSASGPVAWNSELAHEIIKGLKARGKMPEPITLEIDGDVTYKGKSIYDDQIREAHIFKEIKAVMDKSRVADSSMYPNIVLGLNELQNVLDFIQYKQVIPTTKAKDER